MCQSLVFFHSDLVLQSVSLFFFLSVLSEQSEAYGSNKSLRREVQRVSACTRFLHYNEVNERKMKHVHECEWDYNSLSITD